MNTFGRLLVVATLTLATSAQAAKHRPIVLPLDPPSLPVLGSGECTLGHAGPPAWTVNYVDPPDDVYYTHLDYESCVVTPRSALARLEFPVACPQTFRVAIVGSTGETCPVPDPGTVICGPVTTVYTPPGVGAHDVLLALPLECALSGDAFLAITFVEESATCATLETRPRLVTGDQCEPCRSYNHYPGGQDDLCALQLPGRPIMSVRSDAVVPNSRATWGAVRLRYR